MVSLGPAGSGKLQIIKTDHGKLFRNFQIQLIHSDHRPHGHLIVGNEYGCHIRIVRHKFLDSSHATPEWYSRRDRSEIPVPEDFSFSYALRYPWRRSCAVEISSGPPIIPILRCPALKKTLMASSAAFSLSTRTLSQESSCILRSMSTMGFPVFWNFFSDDCLQHPPAC